MKIKLLNDGGYSGMENVKFPVEVEGQDWLGLGYDVSGSELIRIGADPEKWKSHCSYCWANDEVKK